jgi:segregation and condensation protein A
MKLKIVVSNTPAQAVPAEPQPEQVEMPFAMVNGEPVTQMPRDLYIPPQALEVFLEAFEGPLDLLLYLIRRQNLNILDIPLAEITRQYMKYIEVMTELQLELAGEYMVMAATLAEIKSRMLLPRPKVDPDGNEEDPRAELVRRLQEYERFKRAAEGIDSLPRLERDVWPTSAEMKDRKVVRLLPQITLQEMLVAFKDVVVRSEMFAHHHIQRERLSVRARMGDILSTLEHSSFVEFARLFRPEEGRMGITVTFVAILELVREGLIDIVQAEPFAPLHVRAAGSNRMLRVVTDNGDLVGEVGDGATIGPEQGPDADELEVAAAGEHAVADEDGVVDEHAVDEQAAVDEHAVDEQAAVDEHAVAGAADFTGEQATVDDHAAANVNAAADVSDFTDETALDDELDSDEARALATEEDQLERDAAEARGDRVPGEPSGDQEQAPALVEQPVAVKVDTVAVEMDDSANEEFGGSEEPPADEDPA